MGGTIRVRVKGGLLEPLEKIDLPDGLEVLLMIVAASPEPDLEAFRRAAGGWRGTVDADGLIRNIYSSRTQSS
ncbi:MAG: antitoxin family protein [Acidobacteria bacterium]|nr:antitoxin family protein [Acidobacteriota bacterium]